MTLVTYVPKVGKKAYKPKVMTNRPEAEIIRTELLDQILHAADNSERNLQKEIGPSEIGHPCNRNLAYKLAGVTERPSLLDPWPSIVGTAVHAWLEANLPRDKWFLERKVWPSETIAGHSDAYHIKTNTVIDFKVLGPTQHAKYTGGYVAEMYEVQRDLYGLGMHREGFPVKDVGLAIFCRTKSLRDLYVTTRPWNQANAEKALKRLGDVREVVDLLGISDANRQPVFQIKANAGDACHFCPFKGRTEDGYCALSK